MSDKSSSTPAHPEQAAGPAVVPAKHLGGEYPMIDCDPHIKRVFSYTRPSDWAFGAGLAALGPSLFWYWEKRSPTFAPKNAFRAGMRLNVAISVTAALMTVHQVSWSM